MLRKAKDLLEAAKTRAEKARDRVATARARVGALASQLGAPERLAAIIRGAEHAPGGASPASSTSTVTEPGKDAIRARPLSPEEALRAQIQALLDERINPQVAMHGGYINLVEVRDQRVLVTMEGGCHGCAASMLTLKAGVERTIREVFPEIVAVEDVTDHALGENPFL